MRLFVWTGTTRREEQKKKREGKEERCVWDGELCWTENFEGGAEELVARWLVSVWAVCIQRGERRKHREEKAEEEMLGGAVSSFGLFGYI